MNLPSPPGGHPAEFDLNLPSSDQNTIGARPGRDTQTLRLCLATQLLAGLLFAFIWVFLVLVFETILRREKLALIALGILITVLLSLVSESSSIIIPFNAVSVFLLVYVLQRYGLLAMSATLFVAHLNVFFPMTSEFTAWYASEFTIALAICVFAGGLCGLCLSRRRESVWGVVVCIFVSLCCEDEKLKDEMNSWPLYDS